jgi:hypothetical protein
MHYLLTFVPVFDMLFPLYLYLDKLVKRNHLETKIKLICILNNQLIPRSEHHLGYKNQSVNAVQ